MPKCQKTKKHLYYLLSYDLNNLKKKKINKKKISYCTIKNNYEIS